jgi:phosphate butyryltransferase
MPLPTFEHLHALADDSRAPVRIVAIGGEEPTVLEALSAARFRGWVEPVLTGNEAEIRRVARAAGIEVDGIRIVDTDAPAPAAVEEIRGGRAEVLMKGRVATPDLMRAVLDRDTGLRTGRTICQVVLLELPRIDRRFLLADTGVTVRPTIEQRGEIVESTIAIARKLGVDRPRIALMAATEKPTDALPDSVEAAELARRHREEGAFAGAVVEGPLSFDLAFTPEAGARKGLAGEVVGAADATVFPDLTSGNLVVKALMSLADCRFGGLLAGVACPVVFMSRADSTETRLNSLAYALATRGGFDR